MRERKEIEELVREFVVEQLLDGDAGDLTNGTNLLALGVLDSLAMVSLRVFVERTFGVRLPDGVQPENIATISAIAIAIENGV